MISNTDSVNTPVHRLISFPTVFGIPNKPTDCFERRDFTSGKNCTLIEKDHLGDWSPEKDYCLWLTFRQPVRNPSSESLSDSLIFSQLKHQQKLYPLRTCCNKHRLKRKVYRLKKIVVQTINLYGIHCHETCWLHLREHVLIIGNL